jgi:hypothetical protein
MVPIKLTIYSHQDREPATKLSKLSMGYLSRKEGSPASDILKDQQPSWQHPTGHTTRMSQVLIKLETHILSKLSQIKEGEAPASHPATNC